MSTPAPDTECCQRTREEWERRIRLYYRSFPVIKNVPCQRCQKILEIRVYDAPGAAE